MCLILSVQRPVYASHVHRTYTAWCPYERRAPLSFIHKTTTDRETDLEDKMWCQNVTVCTLTRTLFTSGVSVLDLLHDHRLYTGSSCSRPEMCGVQLTSFCYNKTDVFFVNSPIGSQQLSLVELHDLALLPAVKKRVLCATQSPVLQQFNVSSVLNIKINESV